MRSHWIRVGLNPMPGVLRREKVVHRDTDTQGECHATAEAEIGLMCAQANTTKDYSHHELGGGKKGWSPGVFRENVALADTLILDTKPPELREYISIFKPPNPWYFVRAAS